MARSSRISSGRTSRVPLGIRSIIGERAYGSDVAGDTAPVTGVSVA
jgi:hypothetical protein